ncbi:hypothetical protein KKH27_07900 [bacterium]|nr:hypothetical protein [bacterium]MBU1983238.1 hypothetical protein [bacterium]
MLTLPFFKSRPRPLVPPRVVTKRAASGDIPSSHKIRQPMTVPAKPSVTGNLFTTTLAGQDFVWMGTNRAEFYRYLRDHVPIISSAVWSWVHLCATPQSYAMEGPESEKERAARVLNDLGARIFENPLVRRDGIQQLTEQFFLELFTVGSFAGEIIPLADGSGIDYLHTFDPDLIHWERDGRWKAYIVQESFPPLRGGNTKGDEKRIYLNPERFFFATLGADVVNPRGIEPLASIPFVAQIQEAMLSDMARSTRNAGTPRLQIRIRPPKAFQHEGEKEYQARINHYFDDTVSQFQRLDADDNIFTWDDVEVTLIGGDSHRNFTWRLNREQVIEDVITGLRLYPWVVGRSHGTTKNWVESQFNLLMQIVDSVQGLGVSLGNFLRNTELRMKGLSITTEHVFAPNQDPFLLSRMQARAVEFDTVHKKVLAGYISKDDGARELGYENAFQE